MPTYALIDNRHRTEAGTLTPRCFVAYTTAPNRQRAVSQSGLNPAHHSAIPISQLGARERAKLVTLPILPCPHTVTVKAGKTGAGNQKYKCRACGNVFVKEPQKRGAKPLGDAAMTQAERDKRRKPKSF